MKNLFLLLFFTPLLTISQGTMVKGKLSDRGNALPGVTVWAGNISQATISDSSGYYQLNVSPGKQLLHFRLLGYKTDSIGILIENGQTKTIHRQLQSESGDLEEVVVTGTMKEISRTESPVYIERFTSTFFKKNPSPSIFEGLRQVNGVMPQINCSVCNTGDIHINGMEGPYTFILIDGMPLVSSLSTVYGLSGIPNSMIKRIEIMKGPGSTQYGSEALGGIINLITRDAEDGPKASIDFNASSWQEYNLDAAKTFQIKRNQFLISSNVFYYNQKYDYNKDNFTDVTLQKRISVFFKSKHSIRNDLSISNALRVYAENRSGGEMQWKEGMRGSDVLYGESIYTRRFEYLGKLDKKFKKSQLNLDASYNYHHQNSVYGTQWFIATQQTAFTQLLWNSKWQGINQISVGVPFRFTHYIDNTAISKGEGNDSLKYFPTQTILPGIFIQHELHKGKHRLLSGIRFDQHSIHGPIFSPRINYKFSPFAKTQFRIGFGNGYRVVNVFTEDHAALTGSRKVIFTEDLKPEQSYNVTANLSQGISIGQTYTQLELSGFYTHFTNKIIPDYFKNDNAIYYENLKGFAVAEGIAFNFEFTWFKGIKINGGLTIMDVFQVEKDLNGSMNREDQILAPKSQGSLSFSLTLPKALGVLDLTASYYGKMRLATVTNDHRPDYSKPYTLLNLQWSKQIKENFEIYISAKNLLDFIPREDVILRSHDPFDKKVLFDSQGNALSTTENPRAQTFDTGYNYAPLQGFRILAGIRLRWD